MYEEGLRGTEFVQVHENVWKTITLLDEALAPLVVDPIDYVVLLVRSSLDSPD
jgi:hypothetical protein